MKRISVFLLFMLFMLTGCNQNTPLYYPENFAADTESPKMDYVYIPSTDSTEGIHQTASVLMAQVFPSGKHIYFTIANMLYRFNPETGNLTTACPDPLCSHDSSDCAFYGNGLAVTYVSVFDNRIYFRIRERDEANRTYRESTALGEVYDVPTILTSKVFDIAEQKVTISNRDYTEVNLLYINEYCTENEEFYFDMIHDEETDQWSKALKCYDTRTKKTRVISNFQESTNTVFIKYENGNLLYCDEISFGWLDTQTGKKTPLYEGDCVAVSCDDSYYYFKKTFDNSLWRMPISGGEPEYLGVNDVHSDYNVTEKYIYFRYIKRRQVATRSDGQPDFFYGQEVWRMDKDGKNLKKLFEFTGENENIGIDYMVIQGNYLYGQWKKVDENGKVILGITATDTLWGSILRIDLTTGELYYIEVPK